MTSASAQDIHEILPIMEKNSMPKISRSAYNAVHPWHTGLVVKLMVGKRGVVYRLSPWLLMFCLLSLVVGVKIWFDGQRVREEQLQGRIEQLEADKRRAQTFLQRKEREKKQALALAQARSEELWEELRLRDQQMEQIWKMVGRKPQAPPKPRRTLAGARGGTHPLVLKRRYLEIQEALQGDDGEIEKLRLAASQFRKAQIRKAELAMWDTRPSLWPCDGYFSSPFGYRIHPVLGYARFHAGCDISAPTGTPIRATAAGKVTCADWLGGYGLAVTIDHGGGLSTLYGHCSSVTVRSGQYVRKGQVIASVGSTGMSTGPHCHYEVSVNGAQVDPAPYMRSRR